MYVIWLFLIIIILVSSYILLYFKFDIDHEQVTLKKVQLMSLNDNLRSLLNASCINNIPNLNINTHNDKLQLANDCANDPLNKLWDYKYNELVKTSDILMYDENEKLSDGNYRFRCRYNGFDDMHNQYIEHPTERLHPIRNYCSKLIYDAHPSIKPIFSNTNYECDCGNYYVTRVSHLYPGDKSTPCSDKQFETSSKGKKKY